MNHQHLTLFVSLSLLLLLPVLAGCGGGETTPETAVVATPTALPEPATVAVTPPTPQLQPTAITEKPAQPAAGIQILEATFAHGLSDEMQPEDPDDDFQADETVYLSLKIKGRPKKGLVTARFYWHDQLIAEAGVDLADVNSGVLFSIGENTYAGYTLTHEQPFPISDNYHAAVLYDDQPLGDYPFHVVPGPDAIPTQIRQVTLARGVDADYNPTEPTTTFVPTDTVHLVGRGDLGLATWLQADWYVGEQLDEAGTRSLTLEENAPDTGFAFSYIPEGGWPEGEHSVVLTVNDVEVGRYNFTIEQPPEPAAFDEDAFWDAFPLPDDAEVVPVTEGYDLGLATGLIEPQIFDFYATWLSDRGWQQQAPTEAMVTLPHQVWRKGETDLRIEIQGLDDQGRTVVWVQVEGR